MFNFPIWIKFNFSLCLIIYGTSLVFSLTTNSAQRPEAAIELRAVVEGRPLPPCRGKICSPGATKTSPGLKDVVAANKSNTITEPTYPKTRQSAPITCGDTESMESNNQPIFPKTHQTAPIKCGDTGLPPPCGNLPLKSTDAKYLNPTRTRRSKPVKVIEARSIYQKSEGSGVPAPCGSALAPCTKKKDTK
ncbi:uncharacterized protein MELLADRAFT_101723 [Melampsora larici-populina 98AG31]|uniref:Secreted protein n=1 Tax=Melampsora larici-populina (strain 98AG31 / pathotype 3-4-7) TaxID=747676 RepID=F4R6R8_MELLP|nr:uncharacterized protein MELLADRAFT_101723 [Melampsora larici-populina 98AG31]EGG12411.1 secreted protein [Melampsora larici-populina 98AG31]